MLRIFLLLSIFILSLSSSTIHFQEEKYIEVIGNSIIKKGTLTFENDSISLKYKNTKETLVYKNNELFIKNDKTSKKIDTNKQVSLKIVFLLIEAIHKNDLELLSEYFNIKKENKIFNLNPKDELKNYIKDIQFKKDTKLDFITINMLNGNSTTIREIND